MNIEDKLKEKMKHLFDFYQIDLIVSIVNWYINGMSLTEISCLVGLSEIEVDGILDKVIPYMD